MENGLPELAVMVISGNYCFFNIIIHVELIFYVMYYDLIPT